MKKPIDDSVVYDFNNKSIEQLKEEVERLVIENYQLREMLNQKVINKTRTKIGLWYAEQNGRKEHTRFLATVERQDEKKFCEWWQIYNDFIPDGKTTKFVFYRNKPEITWCIEKGERLMKEKLEKSKFGKMGDWINERR